MSKKPEPNEFLFLPIVSEDLIAFFRGSDISRPLFVSYSKFVEFISKSISPSAGLLLKTNGTNNGSQTLLNLVQGSGITIADDGAGNITFTSTGGGSITADNGLTMSTATNVQLGGSLIQDTVIATNIYDLTLSSSTLASGYILNIINGNTAAFSSGGLQITTSAQNINSNVIESNGAGSNALRVVKSASGGSALSVAATASGASGVSATATTSVAVQGQSSSSSGGSFSTSTGFQALFASNTSGANVLSLISSIAAATLLNEAIKITRSATGVGVGSSISTYINSTVGSSLASNIITKLTDNIAASYTSQFSIQLYSLGVLADKMIIDGNGQVIFSEYGSGTFTGTAAYTLAVDASGNVIEVTPSGGSGTVTSVGLSVPSPASPAFSVSGSPVTTSGTLAINALGSTSQYIRGDGSLATLPSSPPNVAVYPTMTSTYLGDINPLNIAHGDAVNRLYLPAFGSNSVDIYDTATNEYVGTISLTGPQSAYYIQSNGELIVTRLSASGLNRYNATTGVSIAAVAGGGTRGTDFVEYSATKLFITNSGTNNLSVYNPTTNVFDATIAGVGTFPFGICWNQNGASAHNGLLVITALSSNGVSIVNPATNTLVAGAVNPSSKLSSPFGIAYVASVDQYYVCSLGNNKVVVLTPNTSTTFTWVKDIDGIINPRWIRYSALTGYLYVVFGGITSAGNDGRTFVAVIDPATDTIIKIASTASLNTSNVTVHNLALDDTNGYIYVNGYGGGAAANKATQLKIQP